MISKITLPRLFRPLVGRLLLGLSIALACTGTVDRPEDEARRPIVVDGWLRAEHHGLILYTDAPEATARRAFRQLKRFIDVVSWRVNGRPFEVHGRLKVFVFGSRKEYGRFAPEWLAGHASRGDDQNTVALSIEQIFEGTALLYHELTHLVLHNDPNRRFPSWYHEGLAVFFSTSVLRGDVLTVGALSADRVRVMRVKHPLTLRELLSSPLWGQRDVSLFYADAWAFVHFGLLSQSLGGPDRRHAFARFVSRVSRGEAWEPAFLAAFEATPEEITEEFVQHRNELAQMQVLTLANYSVDLDELALVFESVEPLEIARELAQLGMAEFETGLDNAAQLFDLILESSPHDPATIYGRIQVAARRDELDLGDTLWARLGEDQHDGMEAWQAEADLCRARARSLDPDEQVTLATEALDCAVSGYGRVLAEAPDRLSALVGLGKALLVAKREDPALGISALERAAVLSPYSPELRLDLAELLIRSGATSAAVSHLDYVAEAYPGSRFAKRAKRLRRQTR